MKRFDTLSFKQSTVLQKEGMEISAYIAGVNSGVYGLPFVISVRTWARRWFFRKFFYREMKLNIFEVRLLKGECEKVIEYHRSENQVE